MFNQYSLTDATKNFIKVYSHSLNNSNLSTDVLIHITHKIRHSYWVLQVAQEIVSKDSYLKLQSEQLIKIFQITALLHDLWRFEQFNDEIVFKDSEFEHWDAGFKIAKDLWYTDSNILLWIKYHNKFISNSYKEDELYKESSLEQIKEIDLNIKLIRDADKIQNIIYNIFDNGKLFSIFTNKINKPDFYIKQEVLQQFKEKTLISSKLVDTPAEKMLNVLSRVFDLNYESSKRILDFYEFDKFILNNLKKIWVSDFILEDIKKDFY